MLEATYNVGVKYIIYDFLFGCQCHSVASFPRQNEILLEKNRVYKHQLCSPLSLTLVVSEFYREQWCVRKLHQCNIRYLTISAAVLARHLS